MKNSSEIIKTIKHNISKVILGKEEIIDLLLTAILSSGHVLLEDVPGVGKTTLAKALAKSINCNFKRVQFTPDLLPADLTGLNIFNQKTREFEFREGPIFTNILLADEINRATPRTQSSLLESMEERQITVDGKTYLLEKPFFVIATQNPVESYGTFPLPEAQLDRFFMKIKIGYPNREDESRILDLFNNNYPLDSLESVSTIDNILSVVKDASNIYVSKDIKDYILDIVEKTRNHEMIELGASPRGSLSLYKGAKTYAYINGRNFVKPDDIIYLAPYILSHRVILKSIGRVRDIDSTSIINEIIKSIPVPMEKME